MADSHDTTVLPEMPRPVIEAEIERLIGLLDTLDPDPDLEDGGDGEPILGAPEHQAGSWRGLSLVAYQDDREADDGDDEPELGSLERVKQTSWALGGDGEPTCGWTEAEAQFGRYGVPSDEREPCCEDEGSQCDDEGAYEGDFSDAEDECRSGWGSVYGTDWRAEQAHQAQTTAACVSAVDKLRQVQKRYRLAPVGSLRVLGDAIIKW